MMMSFCRLLPVFAFCVLWCGVAYAAEISNERTSENLTHLKRKHERGSSRDNKRNTRIQAYRVQQTFCEQSLENPDPRKVADCLEELDFGGGNNYGPHRRYNPSRLSADPAPSVKRSEEERTRENIEEGEALSEETLEKTQEAVLQGEDQVNSSSVQPMVQTQNLSADSAVFTETEMAAGEVEKPQPDTSTPGSAVPTARVDVNRSQQTSDSVKVDENITLRFTDPPSSVSNLTVAGVPAQNGASDSAFFSHCTCTLAVLCFVFATAGMVTA